MYSKVVAGHSSHIDSFGDFEVLRFSLDLSATGSDAIRVGDMERDHEIRIIAFERHQGGASSIPTADSVLYDNDIILACVRSDRIGDFKQYMHK
jgi:trk system potassium uptake protein TrkA